MIILCRNPRAEGNHNRTRAENGKRQSPTDPTASYHTAIYAELTTICRSPVFSLYRERTDEREAKAGVRLKLPKVREKPVLQRHALQNQTQVLGPGSQLCQNSSIRPRKISYRAVREQLYFRLFI